MEQHLDSAVDRLDRTREDLEAVLKRVNALEVKSSRRGKRTVYDDDDDEDTYCFDCGEYHSEDDCYYDNSDYSY